MIADVDDLVRELLADPLAPNLSVEPDLREAIRASRRRRAPMVPVHISQAAFHRTLKSKLLGERSLDGIYARAYRVEAPIAPSDCPSAYAAVVALANSQVVHFAINALGNMMVHPLTRQLIEWNLDTSVLSKLCWYGMLPDYSLGGAAAFAIARERWEAIDTSERTQLFERLTRLAREFRLVTFAQDKPIPLRVRAVAVDAHSQCQPGDRGELVFDGLA